jgi:hypothetical protein
MLWLVDGRRQTAVTVDREDLKDNTEQDQDSACSNPIRSVHKFEL